MVQQASAPAKVILFGEHAVVYGIPAIAVPVSSLRAYATVEASDDLFTIVTNDIKKNNIALSVDLNDNNNSLTKMASFVFNHFKQEIEPNVKITLKSNIPIASGLGSGAAVSTALGRAVALAIKQTISNKTLNKFVYEVEKIHHGTPSGIDNTVIVYEIPIYFVKGKDIQYLEIMSPFHIVIADTGQRALTHEAVGDVQKLYDSNPNDTKLILDQIDHIVQKALISITKGNITRLGSLMTENHQLLQKLTVSSPKLDKLVGVALEAGALGAKMSGGGRGGNMIALVERANIQHIKDALQQAGATQVFDSIVQ